MNIKLVSQSFCDLWRDAKLTDLGFNSTVACVRQTYFAIFQSHVKPIDDLLCFVVYEFQLKEAMLFQELVFNGLFSRLTKYIKVAKKLNRGTCGPSLTNSSDNWSSNNMYLILPAISNTTKSTSNHAPIDWACIRGTVLAG